MQILRNNSLLISFLRSTFSYHYLIWTYFTFALSRTMSLFKTNLNLLANTSTLMFHSVTQSRTSLPAAFVVGPLFLLREISMHYYTSTEMYIYNCTKSQVCNGCTYRWNSVSEVLSDVRLTIYFPLKVLNILQNNMSRIFRIVLFIVFTCEKTCLTFSLCNIIKICLFVFQFKITLNFTRLITAAV